MGSSASRMSKPDELALFKKLPDSQFVAEIEIPERAENRVPTDRKFLVVLGVALLLLVPFLAYTLANSDLDRYSLYDQCGNVCGKKNAKYDQWSCTGKDFTDKRLLEFSEVTTKRHYDTKNDYNTKIALFLLDRECVSKCSYGYQEVLNFCFKTQDGGSVQEHVDNPVVQWGREVSQYLRSVAWRLTLACFLSLGIAISMLYLFRVATAAMVWSILIGVVTFLTILVILLWYDYSQSKDRSGLVIAPAFFTIVLAILVLVMIFLHKKIALVIALFREAMKATFAMPRLLFVPILTFFVELALVVGFVTILVYLNTSGVLEEVVQNYLMYEANIVMRFTSFFTFWMFFWVSQFITGIQYMVIAGAVSKWYFAKNKNNLESPIMTSASIAFKFHLGSVAFGSMIITIMAIIREFLSSILKSKCIKACVESCLSVVEDFLKYLSKNAYILTAMHGKPFYKSGKRAAQIILQNVVNIAVLNYIGDFILVMAHVLVVLLSLLFTYLIMPDSDYEWTVYVIVAVVALIVAAISFSIFETVIDTIFLCFCEDKLLNDGMARPYAMSRDLMEFMENSKKVFGDKKN